MLQEGKRHRNLLSSCLKECNTIIVHVYGECVTDTSVCHIVVQFLPTFTGVSGFSVKLLGGQREEELLTGLAVTFASAVLSVQSGLYNSGTEISSLQIHS